MENQHQCEVRSVHHWPVRDRLTWSLWTIPCKMNRNNNIVIVLWNHKLIYFSGLKKPCLIGPNKQLKTKIKHGISHGHCLKVEGWTCFYVCVYLHLLAVVNVRLKQVLGDEMVLHTIALLVPLGPAGVWKRAEEKRRLAWTQTDSPPWLEAPESLRGPEMQRAQRLRSLSHFHAEISTLTRDFPRRIHPHFHVASRWEAVYFSALSFVIVLTTTLFGASVPFPKVTEETRERGWDFWR